MGHEAGIRSITSPFITILQPVLMIMTSPICACIHATVYCNISLVCYVLHFVNDFMSQDLVMCIAN